MRQFERNECFFQLSHSGSKPFKCHLCSKSYTTATDLRSHINNHTGKRPYSCTVCGKEFISSKTLKRHAIVHTGIWVFLLLPM